MTHLPSLIKKIDEFCRLTRNLGNITRFAAPPDWSKYDPEKDYPELGQEEGAGEEAGEEGEETTLPYFDDLLDVSRQIKDPGLSQQLRVLAELYSYSMRMGGGYATIARAINNLKDMYGESEGFNIEFILNGMIKELAKAAGGVSVLSGNDNPAFVQRLAQLKNDIESRDSEQQSEALDAYHEEISGAAKGVEPGESPEDLADAGITPDDADIINPAALGYGDKEDPKSNKGWHTTGSGIPYKNWQEYYNNERVSYEADLVNETDPDARRTLEELINLLPVLATKTKEALDLSNSIRSDIADPTALEQAKNKLADMRAELQEIKRTRQTLKNQIRSIRLAKEKQRLTNEAQELEQRYKTSVSLERKEKAKRDLLRVQQELALNELSSSTDMLKAKERNYRLELLHQMSGGAFPSEDWIKKQQQKINEAANLRISRTKYDRLITEQRGQEQAREETPEYEKERGGRRIPMAKLPEQQQIDLEKASFSALVYQFQIDIASATQAARQIIYERKEKGRPKIIIEEYKNIIDEISEAIRTKNREALSVAKNKLAGAVRNDLSVDKYQLKGYIDVLKLEPHFRKVLEAIKEVTKNKKGAPAKLDESGNLIVENFTDKDKEFLQYILNDIHRLRVLYSTYYTNIAGMKERHKTDSEWWLIKQKIVPRFKKVIEDMGRIETHLTLTLHVHRPEPRVYKEKSPALQKIWQELEKKDPARFEKLKQQWGEEQLKSKSHAVGNAINKRMIMLRRITRLAQEAIPATTEIDKSTADQLANNIFEQIYNEEYQRMLSELAA